MDQIRRSNGRFVKKKVLAKELKCAKSLLEYRKKIKKVKTECIVEEVRKNVTCKGQRIVDIEALANNLKCCKCKKILDLRNIVKEKRFGIHSTFAIICDECQILTDVNTGKMQTCNGQNHAESNLSLVLGATHSGIGYTKLKKLLACMDIPNISTDLFKRYEQLVGKSIEETAKESCKKAAEEERRLMLENIMKLCHELPPEIVRDLFPFLNTHQFCNDPNLPCSNPQVPSFSHQTNENSIDLTFYSTLTNIVNIIISYDMGWSKRGNGRNYDSLNGYATIVGFLSKKILDYATRNRKCSMCDKGHNKETHDCRLNFHGSAKAMEADAGVQLIKNSTILKEAGLNVRVVIGDEDSSTIAAVRKESNEIIHKLADKNHLVKHFTGDLYELAKKFKEMKKTGVIDHIKKCFTYAIAQNKGQSTELAITLRCIPEHLYGQHENCKEWCHRQEDSFKQTVKLTDQILFHELKAIFNKYANNAHKFSMAASSQSNESINNIIAHKAPKNICLSKSAACDFRVANAVCTFNDGDSSIINIRKKLNLSPGLHTTVYAQGSDRKREQRSCFALNKAKKLRRQVLKKKRELLRKNKENVEGIKYLPNCGINNNIEFIQTKKKNIVSEVVSFNDSKMVFFDLETSGLSESADILQIAAKSENYTFNVYINPSQNISASATKITGLHTIEGKLYFHDKQLETCTEKEALQAFSEFLNKVAMRCILVAHNASFDKSRLLRLILKHNVNEQFIVISGFSDSLAVLKKTLPDRKGPGMFKLSTLYNDFIKNKIDKDSDLLFHDAEFDVIALEKIVLHFKIEDKLFLNAKTYEESLTKLFDNIQINVGLQNLQDLKNVVSRDILKKMTKAEITSDSLINYYKNQGKEKTIELLTEKVNGKPKVTKNKKVLEKILIHLNNIIS